MDDRGAGQGCVTAKIDLASGSKPTDPIPLPVTHDKGSLGKIVFRGDRLQQIIVEPVVQRTYRSRVAAKQFAGKCVDLIKREFQVLALGGVALVAVPGRNRAVRPRFVSFGTFCILARTCPRWMTAAFGRGTLHFRMGNRLSKIYTRTGDDGTTGLGDGSRVDKDSARVEAYGSVDETNSTIGLILAVEALPEPVVQPLIEIQHDLFDLGGELCIPGHTAIDDAFVERLERVLDQFNDDLPPLKDFILPGGGPATAACHLARTVCRRAERRLWHLARTETVNAAGIRYLNRLSDLLFVLARVLVRHERGAEVIWKRGRLKGGADDDQ